MGKGVKEKIRNHKELTAVIVVLAAIGVILGVIYLIRYLSEESTNDAFIKGHLTAISGRVPGHVTAVHVHDYQRVGKGEVLVELDPRDFQAILDLQKASLSSARAAVEQDRAQVEVALAEAVNAEKNYNRYKQIYDANGGITRQQLDNANAAAKAARAQLDAAKKKVLVDEAKVVENEAQVAQAQLNLSYTRIYAPYSGRIGNKLVEQGEYISVGQTLMSVVPDEIWVIANFRETQLANIRPGQPAKINVDAVPGRTFRGHVDSIQPGTGSVFSLLPPENATGNYVKVVQRVPVKIVFDEEPNDINMLAPGMSVVPVVKIK